MKESIISNQRACFVCGAMRDVELHHIFHGTGNRKLSDADGCVVYLCPKHHRGTEGVHFNRSLDLYLKEKCQKAWEQEYGTREDFIKRYGKSYL